MATNLPIPMRVFRNWQLIEFARDTVGMSREAFKELLRETTEPRRVCRRLQFLRGWSHGREEEDIEAVFC